MRRSPQMQRVILHNAEHFVAIVTQNPADAFTTRVPARTASMVVVDGETEFPHWFSGSADCTSVTLARKDKRVRFWREAERSEPNLILPLVSVPFSPPLLVKPVSLDFLVGSKRLTCTAHCLEHSRLAILARGKVRYWLDEMATPTAPLSGGQTLATRPCKSGPFGTFHLGKRFEIADIQNALTPHATPLCGTALTPFTDRLTRRSCWRSSDTGVIKGFWRLLKATYFATLHGLIISARCGYA
jgi:hypothetical protein